MLAKIAQNEYDGVARTLSPALFDKYLDFIKHQRDTEEQNDAGSVVVQDEEAAFRTAVNNEFFKRQTDYFREHGRHPAPRLLLFAPRLRRLLRRFQIKKGWQTKGKKPGGTADPAESPRGGTPP